MNKIILEAWDKNNHKLREYFKNTKDSEYDNYLLLLKKTIEIIFPENEDAYFEYRLDHKRITEIDNGDYQGTLIYVIASDNYQPNESDHWCTCVSYGSCSGCDTLQSILSYSDEPPNEKQVDAYWTLCLHMVQKLKRMWEVGE